MYHWNFYVDFYLVCWSAMDEYFMWYCLMVNYNPMLLSLESPLLIRRTSNFTFFTIHICYYLQVEPTYLAYNSWSNVEMWCPLSSRSPCEAFIDVFLWSFLVFVTVWGIVAFARVYHSFGLHYRRCWNQLILNFPCFPSNEVSFLCHDYLHIDFIFILHNLNNQLYWNLWNETNPF